MKADPRSDSKPSLDLSRRDFLAGGSALVVGFFLDSAAFGEDRVSKVSTSSPSGPAAGEAANFAPNAFIHVSADDRVTVFIKHIEFGQGPYTGLASLVAEEMDADWAQIEATASPVDDRFENLFMKFQGTGGSTAMANSFTQMREAGATARALLVAAAATTWDVPADEISVVKGRIRHARTKRESGFGAFVEAASKLTPPEKPQLKSADAFVHIGPAGEKLRRVDTPAKVDGSAQYTIDLYREGMWTALVAHPPLFGATVKRIDDKAARKVAGVRDVKAVPSGVAVYADDTWSAIQGRRALEVEWDDSGAEKRSSEEILSSLRELASKKGAIATDRGTIDAALETQGTRKVEAEFIFPYLAHAPMEPLDALVEPSDKGIRFSFGSQSPGRDRPTIAKALGRPIEEIEIDFQLAGGSFGRRAQPNAEFAVEAAHVYTALSRKRPVKLLWTREDDIQGGFYRPMVVHKLRGALDSKGNIAAWDQTVAGQSFTIGSPYFKDGVDHLLVEGASDMPYAIPNLRVSTHAIQTGIPTLWWRSVGHTHTGFAVEAFLDELLEQGGRDAVEGRLALLDPKARQRAVLERAAELIGWGKRLPEGRARGVAVHKSFNSFVAQIVEVEVAENPKRPLVRRVACAVDCGFAVNRDIVRAQMEGGIGYGLGAALYSEINIDAGGRVRESNFDRYRGLRLDEMPEIEVAIVDSGNPPSGVGEPGVPPIAPAVANAWRRLTGERLSRMPWVRQS